MSLTDFSKIPMQQILDMGLGHIQTFVANEALNSSSQSSCDEGGSYVFGKTAAEAAVRHGLVDYSVTRDDTSSVEMFQMQKQSPSHEAEAASVGQQLSSTVSNTVEVTKEDQDQELSSSGITVDITSRDDVDQQLSMLGTTVEVASSGDLSGKRLKKT